MKDKRYLLAGFIATAKAGAMSFFRTREFGTKPLIAAVAVAASAMLTPVGAAQADCGGREVRIIQDEDAVASDFRFLTRSLGASRAIAFTYNPDQRSAGEYVVAIDADCDFSLKIWRDLDRDELWARIEGHANCAYTEEYADPLDKVLGPSLFDGAPIAKLGFGVSRYGFSMQPDYQQPPRPISELLVRSLATGLCLGPRVSLLADVK